MSAAPDLVSRETAIQRCLERIAQGRDDAERVARVFLRNYEGREDPKAARALAREWLDMLSSPETDYGTIPPEPEPPAAPPPRPRPSIAEARAALADADLLHFVAELRDLGNGQRALRLKHGVPEAERFHIYALAGLRIREHERIDIKGRAKSGSAPSQQPSEARAA